MRAAVVQQPALVSRLVRVALLLLCAFPLPALPSFHGRAPLRVARIDSAAGLSHNSVYAVLRDRYGYVWAGTPDGLNRFDGYEVRRFLHDPDDASSLSHQIVRVLLEDRDGNLWIGTGGGLDRFDRASNRFRRVAHGTDTGEVLSLFEDSRGTLWAGTDAGLFRRSRGEERFSRVPAIPAGEIRDFGESPDGVVWALLQREAVSRLHALDGSGATLNVSDAWGWVTNFAIDSRGRFWFKPPAPARLVRHADTLEPEGGAPDRLLVVGRVRIAGEDVWMATDRGLCHGSLFAAVSCRPIDASASWLHNYLRDVWIDDERAVWFGSYTGLSRFDPASKPFETWRHDERDPGTLSTDAVSSIVEGDGGELWIGTFGGGLNRLDRASGAVTRFRCDPRDRASLPHDTVWDLMFDADGVLWIATEAGLASLRSGTNRIERHELAFPADERVGRRATALAYDARRRLVWAAAAAGIYSYDPRTRASVRYALPREHDNRESIGALIVDDDGVIWTGTGSSGVRRFDPATRAFHDYPRRTRSGAPLSSEGFWDLHADGRGSFWIATGMGLSRFDRATKHYEHFLPRDGLPASMVYSVAEDRRGRLWLGTSRGLVRFDRDARGASRFRTFDLSDGLAALEFNRHAAMRARSGELCFGGIGGLTCFDPERIEDDRRPPRVVLTGIEISEGTKTRAVEPFGREEVELRHDNDPFEFTFAALSFASPLKNRYDYRLDGFDRAWIEAGTRRLARYTNVPPGEYVFRVRASNADGVWNEEGASLRVRVLPPFWMTWWFRIAIAAAAAALLYAIYRYRVARLIEMERLRLRIASDLHDDVTSELSGISMMAELMRRRDPDSSAQLGALRDRTTALASVMRDLAWGIHPEHDTAGSMIRRMHSTGSMLLGDTPLQIGIDGIDEAAVLPMVVRRTLFLVYKEALHNAARHARAESVRVQLRQADHALEMTIADDGAGFDPSAVVAGDGLRNMRRRVTETGGEIDVTSGRGKGTVITVLVPLRAERKLKIEN